MGPRWIIGGGHRVLNTRSEKRAEYCPKVSAHDGVFEHAFNPPNELTFLTSYEVIATTILLNAVAAIRIGLEMVRVRGIEPRFQAWEAHVIAVILHPHVASASSTRGRGAVKPSTPYTWPLVSRSGTWLRQCLAYAATFPAGRLPFSGSISSRSWPETPSCGSVRQWRAEEDVEYAHSWRWGHVGSGGFRELFEPSELVLSAALAGVSINIAVHHKEVQVGVDEAIPCLLSGSDDRLASHVEARVD
jgi:hypothetical protein